MRTMITQYELLYIIPATFTDEDIGGVENTVKALLEKNGATIDTTTRLGKFRLAYPITNVRYGNYVLVRFNADGAAIAAIDMALRIAKEVLRHVIIRADEAGDEKFELVQFTEVNLDAKDDRPRRAPAKAADEKVVEEVKSGVAAIEGAKEDAKDEKPELSAEELEKKIDAALEEKA